MAQPQLLQIKLSRFDAQPWGFRLQGGVDFATPLVVQKVCMKEKAKLLFLFLKKKQIVCYCKVHTITYVLYIKICIHSMYDCFLKLCNFIQYFQDL